MVFCLLDDDWDLLHLSKVSLFRKKSGEHGEALALVYKLMKLYVYEVKHITYVEASPCP